jgi:uncharacterized protein (DUF427 family)
MESKTERRRESVWDYPRPPRVEPAGDLIRVEFNGEVIAETTRAWRVLETSHPPVYYLPAADVALEFLSAGAGRSYCEFKGEAAYWNVRVGNRTAVHAAWSYPNPRPAFASIRDHFAFYAGRVDACYVAGERARPQPGDFYGGWITSWIEGPFKGGPGSAGW